MGVSYPPPCLGDTLECLKTKSLGMGVSYCPSIYGQMNPLRNTKGELLHAENLPPRTSRHVGDKYSSSDKDHIWI